MTPFLSQEGKQPPSHTAEEETGALVLQQAAFPLDLVTLFKLLIPLQEKDTGKQSLIPTAERRKGVCNCLCFQPCQAVRFLPLAYYGI